MKVELDIYIYIYIENVSEIELFVINGKGQK
jgi:hypothetical protein